MNELNYEDLYQYASNSTLSQIAVYSGEEMSTVVHQFFDANSWHLAWVAAVIGDVQTAINHERKARNGEKIESHIWTSWAEWLTAEPLPVGDKMRVVFYEPKLPRGRRSHSLYVFEYDKEDEDTDTYLGQIMKFMVEHGCKNDLDVANKEELVPAYADF